MNRDLRRHKRVKIPEDAGVSCEGIDTDLRGPVLVMGMRGAFIRTPVVFPKGTILDMRIRDGEREVETRCAVRDLQPEGIGVEFVQLGSSQEESLKSILKRLGG